MKAISATLLVLALAGCSKDSKEAKDEGSARPKSGKAADAAPAAPVAAAPDAAPATPPKPTGDGRDSVLAQLHDAAHCDVAASPWRPWCIAADGWAKATEAPLPPGTLSMPGLTVEIETGTSVADALTNKVHLSALAISNGKVKIVQVTASNPGEEQMMAQAVADLSTVFKGIAASAVLPPDLAGYLGGLGDKASYPTTRAGTGWTWKGASAGELRKVGDFWVAIEVPDAANGLWVSIYTDKVK
jgi:hypothetical protein